VGKALATIATCVVLAGAVAWGGGQGGAVRWGAPVMAICVAFAFAVQWVAFVPSYLRRTEHYYDLTGSATYLAVVWLAVWASGTSDPRALLMAGAVSIWALRLGSFLFRRVRRSGKDGRFDAIKTNGPRFAVAWTLQGLWVSLTLCATLAAITTRDPAPFGVLDVLGLGVWAAGFGIEVRADREKTAFRARHPGRFVDTGLWAWSRHPNYFGEIVLWSGLAVMAASTLSGSQWVTMVSPLFVYLLLTRVSGVPLLEARADERWGGDARYRDYKARTSVLLLRPPR
jgi:steroid 5-alpha reductase family enzyme